MKGLRAVLDTNALVSALRSTQGASYAILQSLADHAFELCVSVPLMLEYEDVAKRPTIRRRVSAAAVDDILDFLCGVAIQQPVFFLWRPHLPDPKDDAVLELAVAAQAKYIVTYNTKHFVGTEQFGIQVIPPPRFLLHIRQPNARHLKRTSHP